MNAWLTYLKERSPLPALTFLSAGIAVSSMAFVDDFKPWPLLLCVVFTNLIFIQMRLGDELKDLPKDRVVNPQRPLPRGLLLPEAVLRALKAIAAVLVLAGGAIAAMRSLPGGAALAITGIFAWLMYKEFYVAESLSRYPMLYALSHQVIVFPIFGWIGLTLEPGLLHNQAYLGWLLGNFGASFTYEICRKLNPDAHELAGTYAQFYGPKVTVLYTLVFLGVCATGAGLAGIAKFSWPMLGILTLVLLNWLKKPRTHKIVEGVSALSSTVILFGPVILWLMKRWS